MESVSEQPLPASSRWRIVWEERLRNAALNKKKESTYANGARLLAEAGVAQHRSVAAVQMRDHVTGGHYLLGDHALVI